VAAEGVGADASGQHIYGSEVVRKTVMKYVRKYLGGSTPVRTGAFSEKVELAPGKVCFAGGGVNRRLV